MPGFKPTLDEWAQGKLRSGSKHGPVVRSQKQALAIAFSEQRKRKGQRGSGPLAMAKKKIRGY